MPSKSSLIKKLKPNTDIDEYKFKGGRLVDADLDAANLELTLKTCLGYNSEQTARMIGIMIKEDWTIEKANDAIDKAVSKNEYSTNSVGTGLVMNYQKNVRFYTYHQAIEKEILVDCEAVKVEHATPNVEKGIEKPYWAEKNKHPFKLWDDYLALQNEEVV